MSIIKKVAVAGKMEVIDTACDPTEKQCACGHLSFSKGKKFKMADATWVVSEEKKSDNIDYRTIVNTSNGDSEVRTLKSLMQDVKEGFITFIDG